MAKTSLRAHLFNSRNRSRFWQTGSVFATAVALLAIPAYADPAVFFNADQVAGEHTFIDTASAADAAYNAAHPGATQASTIFRYDITNTTGSQFSVTAGGTTVYVKTTRGGSAAINNSNGDEGGNGFTNWSVSYTAGNFNSAILAGYKIAFFSDSNYSTAYNVNAVGLEVSDWGTCCTTGNATPGGGTANASQIYMLFNGSTPLLVGGISTPIAGQEHFIAAIDDRNSFSSVTLVPNGSGEAFGAGGILTFSTVQLNSVPSGSSVVIGAGAIPNILAGPSSTISQLIAGAVNPVFDGGVLAATSSASLATNLTIKGTGGTIETAANDLTLTGTISDAAGASGHLTKAGAGVLTLGGTNSYSGGTTVTAGTLRGTTNGLQGDIVNNAAVEFAQNADGTYAGSLSGSGSLVKSGTGTLMLSGNQSFTGNTLVSDGTLALAGSASLAASSGVTNNGTLDLSGHSGDANIRTIDGSGTVALGSNSLVLTSATGTLTGGITGAGGLIIAGGTETLSGANSFTGSTVIEQGATLAIGSTGSISASANVTSNGTLDISVHTGNSTLGSLDGTGSVLLGGNNLVLSQAGGTMTGTISGLGGLTVAGGSQTLGGANSYAGATDIAQGAALRLTGIGSLGSSSGVTANGTFDVAGHQGDVAIRSLDGLGTVSLGSNTLVLTDAAGVLNGTISGTGGLTVAAGSETLTSSHSYEGATVIAQGATLDLAGNGNVASSSEVTSNGTFDVSGHIGDAIIQSLDGTGLVSLGGNNLVLSNAAGTLAGSIIGVAGLIVAAGQQTLTGASSFTGATVVATGAALTLAGSGSIDSSEGLINNGTFDVAGHIGDATIRTLSGSGSVTLGDNSLVLANASGTLSGAITGTGGLSVAGGSETLTGVNTYSGATVIGAGATLVAAGGGALSDASTIHLNGTLDIVSSQTAGAIDGGGIIQLRAGTLTSRNETDANFAGSITGQGEFLKTGAGTLTLAGASDFSGGLTISQGAVQVAQAANLGNGPVSIGEGTLKTTDNFVSANSVTLTSARAAIDTLGHDVVLAGTVSGTGTLKKLGNGTLTLTGTNSQNGIVVSGGVLAFASDAALGAADGIVVVQANTTLRTLADMTIDHVIKVDNTREAMFDTNGHDITIAGDITGSGIVQKIGAGVLTLTGSNSQVVMDVQGGSVLATRQSAVGASSGDIYLRDASRFVAGSDMTISQRIHVIGSNAVFDTGSNSVTLAGIADGDHCLMKRGEGRLNMVADASNAIGACVQQGTLSFNGNFTGNVWVDPTGTAGGSGNIHGNMEVRGTLAPGNSPGRLVVAGSVTQFAGSTLAVDVDGRTEGSGAGHFDTLVLTGASSVYTAAGTIAPKLRNIVGAATNAFTLKIDDRHTMTFQSYPEAVVQHDDGYHT